MWPINERQLWTEDKPLACRRQLEWRLEWNFPAVQTQLRGVKPSLDGTVRIAILGTVYYRDVSHISSSTAGGRGFPV
jgi:hypothetical protein